MAVSVYLIGTGSSKLPITLDKMVDIPERKENCRFSELAAQSFSLMVSCKLSEDVGLE